MPDHPTEQVDRVTQAVVKTIDGWDLPPSIRDWIDPDRESELARAALDAATPPPEDNDIVPGGGMPWGFRGANERNG